MSATVIMRHSISLDCGASRFRLRFGVRLYGVAMIFRSLSSSDKGLRVASINLETTPDFDREEDCESKFYLTFTYVLIKTLSDLDAIDDVRSYWRFTRNILDSTTPAQWWRQ